MTMGMTSRRVATGLVFGAVVAAGLTACSGNGDGSNGATATTEESSGPATPGKVAVQLRDLPKRFHECDYSGEVNDYIENFKRAQSPSYPSLAESWSKLQSAGATEGYFAVYGDGAVACNYAIGKDTEHDDSLHDDPKGHPSTVWSFVARFKDEVAADAAFKGDVFGQSGLKSQGFDILDGVPTGLGPNSIVATNQADAPVRQAVWQNKAFTVFFGSENLQPEESEDATASIDGRIR